MITASINLKHTGIIFMPKKRKEKEKEEKIKQQKVKFEVYGEEMVEKIVKQSGNCGRVYLPPDWVGHKVKIIRVD